MRAIILVPFLCAALLLVGCGKQDSPRPADKSSDPVKRYDGVATLHITGNDLMRYNINQFTVRSGEKVRLVFENVGKMPMTTMGHDVVILKEGENYQQFANEVAARGGVGENGMIPASLLGRVVAHTKLIGPGEKTTVEFTAPAPGEYPYLCTFPSHSVFMNGRMIVEAAGSQAERGDKS